MSSTLRVMSYEQWEKRNPELLEQMEDCPVCDGDGTHECDCGDEHVCAECDGTGNRESLRDIYEKQKKEDTAKLEAWNKKVAK